MTAEDCLAAFLSRDPQQIWCAGGWVLETWDRAALRGRATSRGQIAASTRLVKLGGMLRPNAVILNLALRKLALAEGETCICTLFPTDDRYDPRREAASGHVALGEEVVDQVTQETRWTCRCLVCEYVATEVTGYHYPWFRWTPV